MNERIEITHNPEESRYELRVDGELVSIAEYSSSGDKLVFDHTETAPDWGGKGLAACVVGAALEDVRTRNLKIVPSCWYVRQFVDEHPEFRDLVA